MDSLRTMLLTYLRAAWRRRWLGVMIAWLVCCLGWFGTYAIPNQYESNARQENRIGPRRRPINAG